VTTAGLRRIEVAPVPASACCSARVLWSTTGDKYDWRFDQFKGRAAIRLGFATHSSFFIFSYSSFRQAHFSNMKEIFQRIKFKGEGQLPVVEGML